MKWLYISVLVFILDQATKYQASHSLVLFEPLAIIRGLNLVLVQNTGAAFSIMSEAGGWQRWFLICLTLIICSAIIYWLYILPVSDYCLGIALALILGGALGNLCDRIVFGYVIDFIEIYYRHWAWPTFNVADAAISMGAGLMIIDVLWLKKVLLARGMIKR